MASSVQNSSSYSNGSSSSTPGAVQTPQSQWDLQLSQLLSALGQYQYGWAQNQFNKASGITDEQINNYLRTAGYGTKMASNLAGRYQNVFQPLQNEYIQEAGSYASAPRINYNMGAAESRTAQAMNAGRINAEQQLQSYGIDPSSGRYAELEASQRAAAAAAEAGAGNQAALATEQTGRQMLLNSVEMGQQIPGQVVNSANSAYQGIAGAENSALGVLNTGANALSSAGTFFNPAAQVKLPPVGNTSVGQNQSKSASSGVGGMGGGSGSGGGQRQSSSGGGGNPNGSGSGAGAGKQSNQGATPDYKPIPAGTPREGNDPSYNWEGPTQDWQGPQEDQSGGGQYDWQGPTQDWQGPQDQGGGEYPSMNYDDTGAGFDYSQDDQGSQGYNDTYDGSYAAGGDVGGMIPQQGGATAGGQVPQSASPSGGRNTDDISARLNANEFVIPRDVAEWKGQEFFQKLIMQSRKARVGAPAKPSQKPALQGQRPSFVSQHMGAQ